MFVAEKVLLLLVISPTAKDNLNRDRHGDTIYMLY